MLVLLQNKNPKRQHLRERPCQEVNNNQSPLLCCFHPRDAHESLNMNQDRTNVTKEVFNQTIFVHEIQEIMPWSNVKCFSCLLFLFDAEVNESSKERWENRCDAIANCFTNFSINHALVKWSTAVASNFWRSDKSKSVQHDLAPHWQQICQNLEIESTGFCSIKCSFLSFQFVIVIFEALKSKPLWSVFNEETGNLVQQINHVKLQSSVPGQSPNANEC